jgi:hypothetical protein
VAHRADGCLILWPPLAAVPPCAPTVPPGRSKASGLERGALGGAGGGWGAFELWILIAIGLLTVVAAAYSLLTATGIFGVG